MNEEEEIIADLQYVVMFYDDNGICSVRSKEGNTFSVAMPWKSKRGAKKYIKSMEQLTGLKGILFHRVK